MSRQSQKRARRAFEIQLTTLVDIFTILVIFLILGTVSGVSDIVFPGDMKLPMGFGKETIESAPKLVISKNEVFVASLDKGQDTLTAIPISDFMKGREISVPTIESLKLYLKNYIARLSPEMKVQGTLLNVIADRETPYEQIFEIVRVFREIGFETLLFVATGDALPAGLIATATNQGIKLPRQVETSEGND
jgi:biopolymer transport protein ExbD